MMSWEQSKRGGHHIFRVKNEKNIGIEIVT